MPYLQGVAVAASVTTLSVIAFDRYLAICRPLKRHLSKKQTIGFHNNDMGILDRAGQKQMSRLIKMLVTVVLIFALSWLPLHIIAIMLNFLDNPGSCDTSSRCCPGGHFDGGYGVTLNAPQLCRKFQQPVAPATSPAAGERRNGPQDSMLRKNCLATGDADDGSATIPLFERHKNGGS
uniref:G_PROTEIN_RECEP_F1_2 domain-containing protein n=1 Tax=Macrostomum lignano TaxID=282301 RepID=A0A1I8FP48_9PLAT